MKKPVVRSSAELFRDLKRWVYFALGCFLLLQVLNWLGIYQEAKGDEALFNFAAGVVIVVGYLLIECTEIILAAIKESTIAEGPEARPNSAWRGSVSAH